MLWKVYLFSYATVSTSWSSHLDSQLHSPLGNPMLLCARMQLVLELYWFRSLSSLGLEVIWGLKRLQYNWWKAAEKGTKNSRVLRRRPRKIRPRSGSLMTDCFHSSQTQKTKKKKNEAWVGAKFGFHSLLCLAVKCSVKAPVQCPLLSRRHPQLTVLVIVRAVATAASLSYSQQPLLLEFVVLDVVLVFVVYCIGELWKGEPSVPTNLL